MSQGQRAERRSRMAALYGVVMLAGAGCIITEPIGFEVEQIPAHLSNAQPAAFTRIPVVADPPCNNEGGVMAFSVDVSDANVTENLEAWLVVNGKKVTDYDIPPTGNVTRAPIIICALATDLLRNCNHVEIVVSSRFKAGRLPIPVDPIDLAAVEWWVLKQPEMVPIADEDHCSELIGEELP